MPSLLNTPRASTLTMAQALSASPAFCSGGADRAISEALAESSTLLSHYVLTHLLNDAWNFFCLGDSFFPYWEMSLKLQILQRSSKASHLLGSVSGCLKPCWGACFLRVVLLIRFPKVLLISELRRVTIFSTSVGTHREDMVDRKCL